LLDPPQQRDCTRRTGQVHVFADDGTTRRDIAPGFYADVVRVGKTSDKDMTATIIAAGHPGQWQYVDPCV